MKHIKLAAAAAFVVGLTAAGSASADNGVIRFTGTVSDATCVVSGGAGTTGQIGNFTVDLPTVPTTALAAPGDTAGRKPFQIVFSDGNGGGCDPAGGTNAHFRYLASSQPVDASTGNLMNTLTQIEGAADNVQLQLLDNANAVIDLRNDAGRDHALDANAPVAVTYGVEYVATGASTAGGVRSFVEYQVTYN
ncbi:fimbrial protein [Dyella sp. BiH032]|uniref:fimbrial protein n=1 Tax=Dyella sp. BiH032 TaxID=3075430 RepID=UPI00289307E4|nr:fimbrial protein [Dyella sp. BiH032]WNL46347.1 fimbrial protein [Dyella sp. BiH032]